VRWENEVDKLVPGPSSYTIREGKGNKVPADRSESGIRIESFSDEESIWNKLHPKLGPLWSMRTRVDSGPRNWFYLPHEMTKTLASLMNQGTT
jgi:hypothetical protein